MQNKFSQHRIVAFACLLPVPLSRCPTVAALAPCQSSRSGVAVPTASGQQQQQQQQAAASNGTATTARALHMSGIPYLLPGIPPSSHANCPFSLVNATSQGGDGECV